MFELLPHQVDAVEKLATGKVLVGDVGTGKSITSLEYARRNHPEKQIVVITTAKKRDTGEWFGDAMKMSLRQDLVVDSWNNIAKYAATDAFFIFDEQRIVGTGAWVKSFWVIAARNPWILLTATPADVWKDLMPVFVANGFYKNASEFLEYHAIWDRFSKFPKIKRYADEWKLEQYRKQIYVIMPMMKKTKQHQHIVKVDFDKDAELRLFRDRWNIYENRPLKDAGEMVFAMRKNANNHWSRLEATRSIAKDNPRLIIFYNFNDELEQLRTLGVSLGRPIAEWNGHKHEPIPDTDEWIYLVQYRAGSEGWNCVDTDTMLFYTLTYSQRDFWQARGRIDRMNTEYTDLHYYILKSGSMIDGMIWRALVRKKNFQVSAFAKKTWAKMTEPHSLLEKHNVQAA